MNDTTQNTGLTAAVLRTVSNALAKGTAVDKSVPGNVNTTITVSRRRDGDPTKTLIDMLEISMLTHASKIFIMAKPDGYRLRIYRPEGELAYFAPDRDSFVATIKEVEPTFDTLDESDGFVKAAYAVANIYPQYGYVENNHD